MYENSLETATMQRAKAILYLEQKLSCTVWRQYCEHIMKECSPEVCSLSEDVCLGRRDKKRTKEKLLRSVEEINNVMNDRFGPKVGTEISDMDQLLADVKKLNDILVSRGQEHSATLTKPGSINLNIILDQGTCPSLNGVALESEELLSAKMQCDAKQSSHEPKLVDVSKQNIELHRNTQNIPSTSSSISDGRNEEASADNHKIQRQLDVILNLMKEAIKNGKLNFTMNGKALVTRTTEQRESVEHLLVADSESDRVQNMANCVDRAMNTQSSKGIMNPACSPVLSQFECEIDETRHSSLDLYMSDDVTVHTPIQSPNLVMADQATINSERLNARYDRSSFLSTSSTDGNTTCDENVYSSSQTSVVSISNNADQRLSPNEESSEARIKPNQTKKSHRRLQPPKTLFLCSSGSSHGGSSESDVSSHESKRKDRKEVAGNRPDFVCEDGVSTSSQSTDITDQSYDDDSQVSGVGHYASADVGILAYNASPERDSLIPSPRPNVVRGPHVRWADTASEPGSTPFLNILEISSPSDNFSGEIIRLESDTTSGDDHEGQSGSERNTRQQTDV